MQRNGHPFERVLHVDCLGRGMCGCECVEMCPKRFGHPVCDVVTDALARNEVVLHGNHWNFRRLSAIRIGRNHRRQIGRIVDRLDDIGRYRHDDDVDRRSEIAQSRRARGSRLQCGVDLAVLYQFDGFAERQKFDLGEVLVIDTGRFEDRPGVEFDRRLRRADRDLLAL